MPNTQTTASLFAGIDVDDPSEWLTVEQMLTLYPQLWRNTHSLRWDLRNRDSTALARFVRILGRRTLIHRDGAARWKLSTAQARDPRYVQ